jgi:crotonobetainyl-CoA:carnitine CoA-transferase CaiB-like acyl-CoA transferase
VVAPARGALAGLRVVELADAHGEWCGKLLADMGADVVKVEPPGGAPTRRIGPFVDDEEGGERSLWFWHYNTSKRSVTLDIDDPSNRETLRRLIAGADVFVETLAPGRAASLGLDYATLSGENARLVHVAVTPFGQTGPYVDAGYRTTDLVSMALGGPMQSCGYDPPDGEEPLPPVRPGTGESYHTASHHALIALLAALYERETSGRGQYIDVSAQAALAVTVEFASLYWEYTRGNVLRQTGRHAMPGRTARTQYICADGKPVNVALPLERKGWLALVGFLKSEGLAEDIDEAEYDDVAKRLAYGSIIFGSIEVLAARHTAEELFHMGQRMGLTWAAVRAPEEWLEDEHARARGFFVEVEHPELGRTVTYPGAPFRMSATPWRIGRRAPLAGEDTEAVLGEVGLEVGG